MFATRALVSIETTRPQASTMAPPAPASADPIALAPFKMPPPDGMIVPHKNTQGQIERLADFLARRPELWSRTYENALKGSKNFLCMVETDEFNPFFMWRLGECKEGRSALLSANAPVAAPLKKEPEKPQGPKEPPPYAFSARLPPNISSVDNETIEITAQFTAKHGPQWMRQLAQRENANPAFDFLRTQHSFHQYFSRLVDQFSDLYNGKKTEERLLEAKEFAEKRFIPFNRAKDRVEWSKYQVNEKSKHDEEETKRRMEFSRIEWNDFQLIDTIDFSAEDDTAELAPPIMLNELKGMSMAQKSAASLVPESRRLEETMVWDANSYNAAPPPMPMPMPMAMPMQPGPYFQPQFAPQYPAPPVGFNGAYPDQAAQQAHSMAQAAIASVSQPAAPGYTRDARAGYLVSCPNCGERLPPAELEAHIKIELMDPDSRKQKERAASRYEPMNQNHDVTGTLKRMVGARPDMFDSVAGQWAGDDQSRKRSKY